MKKFRQIMKRLEDTMSAASFAEEGAFRDARNALKEERRVLLAVREHQVAGKTLKYALNTCMRVGADLDILYISSSDEMEPVVERFLPELSQRGILFSINRRTGCLKQAIINFTNERKEVLFVVIESSDHLDVDCARKDGRLSESWDNLRCPLVVVSEGAKT